MLEQETFLIVFRFKNCLFRITNIANNSDKEKYVYSGYGITFDSAV